MYEMLAGAIEAAIQTGIEIYAQERQQRQLEANAEHAREMAEYQAEILEQKADAEREDRNDRERAARRKQTANLATLDAMFAKSGTLLSGSVARYLDDFARTSEYNIQQERYASERRETVLRHNAQETIRMGEEREDMYQDMADEITTNQILTALSLWQPALGLVKSAREKGSKAEMQNMMENQDVMTNSSLSSDMIGGESKASPAPSGGGGAKNWDLYPEGRTAQGAAASGNENAAASGMASSLSKNADPSGGSSKTATKSRKGVTDYQMSRLGGDLGLGQGESLL